MGYEIFSGSVDAIVAKNRMKKIIVTMIDMELEDNLKLKVATRLMDKNAATWWEKSNSVLLFLLLGSCLYESSTINTTLVSTETKNSKSFSNLDSLGSL